MRQEVVLITGASSGFGRLAADRLARHGYRVFGTSRRPQLQHDRPYPMLTLDVRNDESVHAAVEQVLRDTGRLDVLVNNAGYALASLIEEAKIDEAKGVFETNFWGAVRMTKAVLPAMRGRRSGRIINISSLAGLIGVPGEGFYSATKFALEGYTESLAHEVRVFNIHVSLIEPGYFKTGFGQARKEGTDLIPDYNPIRGRIMAAFDEGARLGGDPAKVAALIQQVIETPRPRLRYRVGHDSAWLPRLRGLMPQKMFAWGTRKVFHIPGKI